jgi:hypothetical protein
MMTRIFPEPGGPFGTAPMGQMLMILAGRSDRDIWFSVIGMSRFSSMSSASTRITF